MNTSRSPQEKFVRAAQEHGRRTKQGNASAANRAYVELVSAVRELRATSDKGEAFLESLLKDQDPSIVTWAALYLLPYRPDAAAFALERTAKTAPPLIALGAEITLREWRAGRLDVE